MSRSDDQGPALDWYRSGRAMELTEEAVRHELATMGDEAGTAEERASACRALVRWHKKDQAIARTEDWVRLYVALRRCGSEGMRLNSKQLEHWNQRVMKQTTIKRKVFIVSQEALDGLEKRPPDLHKWTIPRGTLDLPADIYGNDVVFIDDGYDRALIPIPGILHLEVAVKWSVQANAGAAALASSTSSPGLPAAPAAAATAPAADLALTVAPAAQPQSSDGLFGADNVSVIVNNTMKAIGVGRWHTADKAAPDTVEFWLRIFVRSIRKKVEGHVTAAPAAVASDTEKTYIKFLTKELFDAGDGFEKLRVIVPHFIELQRSCPELLPSLAIVVIKIAGIDLTGTHSEEEFHEHMSANLSIEQTAFVYTSPLYQGFLKHRFNVHMDSAKKDEKVRKQRCAALLASAEDSNVKAKLRVVMELDGDTLTQKEKIELLWQTPLAASLMEEWTGLRDEWWKYTLFRADAGAADWKHSNTKMLHACLCEMKQIGITVLPNVALQHLFEDVQQTPEALLPVFMEQLAFRTGAQNSSVAENGQEEKNCVMGLDRSDYQQMQAMPLVLLPLCCRCTVISSY